MLLTLKEKVILEAHIDVLCPLQWGLLSFSAPTNLNRKFVNNGTQVAKFRDTINSAIELTCNTAFHGAHTPRVCFLRAVTIFCATAGMGCREDRLATLTAIRDNARRAMNDA